MSVRIRLTRTGRKNRPCHRLCAIDRRTRRDGRVLEILGLYDPLSPRVGEQLKLKPDRVIYWVSKGAQLSVTAKSLCRRAGIALPETDTKKKKRDRKKSPAKVKARQQRVALLGKAKKERREARISKAKTKAAKEAKEG
ncbi:MAG: 30S ribosomal protein S16 [Planctomycetota bacterium]